MAKKNFFLALLLLALWRSASALGADPSMATLYEEGGLRVYVEDGRLMAEGGGKPQVVSPSFDPDPPRFSELLAVSPGHRFIVYTEPSLQRERKIRYHDLMEKKGAVLDRYYFDDESGVDSGGIQWLDGKDLLAIGLNRSGALDTCLYDFGHTPKKKYCLRDLFDPPPLPNTMSLVHFSGPELRGDRLAFKVDGGLETWEADLDGRNLVRTGVFDGEPVRNPFKDLSVVHSTLEFFFMAYDAKSQGWLTGYPDGTVRLNDTVNRAEFVKMAIKAFGQAEVDPGTGQPFPDVPPDAWYAPTLYAALKLGAITGYPDGTARPGQTVNWAEALKIVLEIRGGDYPESAGHDFLPRGQWYSGYLDFADDHGISSSFTLSPKDTLQRWEAVKLISKVLEMK